MIEIDRVRKRFSHGRGKSARVVQAVDGVSFGAADACITGLLGPNGAGKTTTLRLLAGLLVPDAGTLRVDGIDVQREPQAALARMGVLSDARGLYPRLTARENIVYYGRLHGLSGAAASQRAEQLAHLLDMTPLLERRSEGFSQGERMKTALARALRDALRRLRDIEGKCIVFSTHIMQEVERLCDRVVVVSHGRAVAEGTVASLNAQCGERDFEESFVKLAFSSDEREQGS